MQPDVSPVNPAGGWTDDATTTVDPLGPRAARHRNLLRAVLLYYDPKVAWDHETRGLWQQLTGQSEVSLRALCDAIRASGLSLDIAERR